MSRGTDGSSSGFEEHCFEDPVTGERLRYNLFAPHGADDGTRYPLVLFIHDAGTLSDDPSTTLRQGDGATVWAAAAEQAARPAFVLAPQYPDKVVDDWDGHVVTPMLDTTVRLLQDVIARHPVDRDRVYATGQSMGGMMEIVMASRHPDLFAALYLVACQWDAGTVAPLARRPVWILVSEGDAKAHPGQQAIVAELERAGALVDRAVWDAGASTGSTAEAARAVAAGPGSVKFVALDRATVLGPGEPDDPGRHHVATWRIAYGIEPIREWLFEQRRTGGAAGGTP